MIGGEIVFAQETSRLAAKFADTLCDGTAIDILANCFDGPGPSLFCLRLLRLDHGDKGAGQIWLREYLPRFRNVAAGEKYTTRGRPGLNDRAILRDVIGQV